MSAEAAVAWAKSKVGWTESPPSSNKGPGITQWEVASGYAWVANAREGVPWCQCFANAAAEAGGCPQLKDGFTPTVLNGSHADWPRIDVDDTMPGDFIFFKWPGVSHYICDHVGILLYRDGSTVTCVEGNTSPSTSGSQNNGGGVWVRARSRSLVAGAVAPPYPDKRAYRNLKITAPYMHGSDIMAFQVAINKRADGCGRGGLDDRGVEVDGVYGTATRENGAWAAYILGIGDSTADLKEGGISAYVQDLVRNPDHRNEAQKEQAGPRRAAYCR